MPSPAGVVAHAWRGTLPTARLLRPDPDRVSAPTRQRRDGSGAGHNAPSRSSVASWPI